MSAALSQTIFVIGSGSSSSHGLFAWRPSNSFGSGRSSISDVARARRGGERAREAAGDLGSTERHAAERARGLAAEEAARERRLPHLLLLARKCSPPSRSPARGRVRSTARPRGGRGSRCRSARRRGVRSAAAGSRRSPRALRWSPHVSSSCARGRCQLHFDGGLVDRVREVDARRYLRELLGEVEVGGSVEAGFPPRMRTSSRARRRYRHERLEVRHRARSRSERRPGSN